CTDRRRVAAGSRTGCRSQRHNPGFSLRRQPVGSHRLRDHFGAVARRGVARVLDPRTPCHTTRSACGPARGIASACNLSSSMAIALAIGHYFGRVNRRQEFAGAVVSEVVHPRERTLPKHRHEAPYFCLLPRGDYVEEVEGRRLEYGPFSVGFHPPSTHQDWIGRAGAVFFFIELQPEWLRRAADLLPSDPDFEPRLLDGDLSCLAARLYRLHGEGGLDTALVDGVLWELAGCLWRSRRVAEAGQPRWLASCLELLREEFSQPLTVLEVASAVNVHRVPLSREFRRRFRQTMGEYVHNLRIQAACEELENPERPLTEIALATGFADHSHFCRVFKSRIGCSPSRFRELLASA